MSNERLSLSIAHRGLAENTGMFYPLACHLSAQLTGIERDVLFYSVIQLGLYVNDGHTGMPISDVSGHEFYTLNDLHNGFYSTSHSELEQAAQGVPVFTFPDGEILSQTLLSLDCVFDADAWIAQYNDAEHVLTQTCAEQLRQRLHETHLVLFDGVLSLAKYAFMEFDLARRLLMQASDPVNKACQSDALYSNVDVQKLEPGENASLFDTHALISNELTEHNKTQSSLDDEIDWQQIAIDNCMLNRLNIVVGGPGTGKTTTVAGILERIAKRELTSALSGNNTHQRYKIGLAAPTGKAATRLKASIFAQIKHFDTAVQQFLLKAAGGDAKTLHRLLAWQSSKGQFTYNRYQHLPYDCLIIDEASMIDLPMFYHLLVSIKPDCELIFLGDADQLSSVHAGSVLSDLSKPNDLQCYSAQRLEQLSLSDRYLSVNTGPGLQDSLSFLRKSYRFDPKQGIGALAAACLHETNNAELALNAFNLPSNTLLDKSRFSDKEVLLGLLVSHFQSVNGAHSAAQALTSLKTLQLLCAKKEGNDSVEQWTQWVLGAMTQVDVFEIQSFQAFAGMPVMVTQNQYDIGLYNGDVGVIWPVMNSDTSDDSRDETVHYGVYFEDVNADATGDDINAGLSVYLPSQIQGLVPAIAITVHKSQGSEYEHVALVMPESGSKLLTRQMFYTALTRAKSQFTCLAQADEIKLAVQTQSKRYSNLSTWIDRLAGNVNA